MKMINTPYGYMMPLEYKMINDIYREEKIKKEKEQKNGSKKRRN